MVCNPDTNDINDWKRIMQVTPVTYANHPPAAELPGPDFYVELASKWWRPDVHGLVMEKRVHTFVGKEPTMLITLFEVERDDMGSTEEEIAAGKRNWQVSHTTYWWPHQEAAAEHCMDQWFDTEVWPRAAGIAVDDLPASRSSIKEARMRLRPAQHALRDFPPDSLGALIRHLIGFDLNSKVRVNMAGTTYPIKELAALDRTVPGWENGNPMLLIKAGD